MVCPRFVILTELAEKNRIDGWVDCDKGEAETLGEMEDRKQVDGIENEEEEEENAARGNRKRGWKVCLIIFADWFMNCL